MLTRYFSAPVTGCQDSVGTVTVAPSAGAMSCGRLGSTMNRKVSSVPVLDQTPNTPVGRVGPSSTGRTCQ